jgi:hypothetical protein
MIELVSLLLLAQVGLQVFEGSCEQTPLKNSFLESVFSPGSYNSLGMLQTGKLDGQGQHARVDLLFLSAVAPPAKCC